MNKTVIFYNKWIRVNRIKERISYLEDLRNKYGESRYTEEINNQLLNLREKETKLVKEVC